MAMGVGEVLRMFPGSPNRFAAYAPFDFPHHVFRLPTKGIVMECKKLHSPHGESRMPARWLGMELATPPPPREISMMGRSEAGASQNASLSPGPWVAPYSSSYWFHLTTHPVA